jgi:hypothetical protein
VRSGNGFAGDLSTDDIQSAEGRIANRYSCSLISLRTPITLPEPSRPGRMAARGEIILAGWGALG